MSESPATKPDRDGRLTAAIRRRPRRWFWLPLAVALFIGVALGAGSSSQQNEVDRLDTQLQDARAETGSTRDELTGAKNALEVAGSEMDEVRTELDDANSTIKRLRAKGELPDLTGGTVGDAKGAAGDYLWNFKTVTRARSDVEPGTVVEQSPVEGTVLRSGRSVTLTVAKKPPPSWKSIFTFTGAGARKSDEFTIPRSSKARIAYSFAGDTNAILELGVPGDEFGGELLLNEIGDFSDVTRVYNHAGRRFLDVEGGTWNIDVQVFK